MQISELVMQFQTTAFEMNLAGLISDREFAVLEAITESMTAGSIALDLLSIITMENLQDADIVDCIIARKFGTALMIMD